MSKKLEVRLTVEDCRVLRHWRRDLVRFRQGDPVVFEERRQRIFQAVGVDIAGSPKGVPLTDIEV